MKKIKQIWAFIVSPESLYVVLSMMFAGALITSNVVAYKISPIWFGTFNVGTFCYAITLLISNLVNYLFGTKKAKYLIAGGFAAQILSTILIMSLNPLVAVNSSSFVVGGVEVLINSQEVYNAVLGQNWIMVIGSLLGYLFCQIVNYLTFNKLLKKIDSKVTKGLWNFLANIIGQLLDTIVFDVVVFGLGFGYFVNGMVIDLTNMVLLTWLFKVAIAAVYTLVFYLSTLKKRERESI